MSVFRLSVATLLICFSSLATNSTPSTNSTNPLGQCSTTADCNHGVCNNATNVCSCDRGYLSAAGQLPCTYQQKSSATAGTLEFVFPGFGFGQMYLQNYGLGFGKFALNVVIAGLVVLPFVAKGNGKIGSSVRDCLNSCPTAVMWSAALIATVCAQIAWWLHDGIVIVQGNYVGIVGQRNTWHYEPYKDGNGYYINGCTACPN